MNMTEILDKKDIPEIAGIYCFENVITGKKYIGSSVNLRTRYTQHLSQLSENIHSNRMLQEAYDNTLLKYYLVETFPEGISQDGLLRAEQKWIDYYNTTNPKFGYNKVNSYKSSFKRNVISGIKEDNPKRKISVIFVTIFEEILRRQKGLRWAWIIWKILRRA